MKSISTGKQPGSDPADFFNIIFSESLKNKELNHRYKAVFIDLDDTIWDFHTNARLTLLDMYNEYGLNNYFDDFDQFFGIYAQKNTELWEQYGKGEVTQEFLMTERFRYSMAQMGLDNFELAREIGDKYLKNLPDKKSLMPHTIELLSYLKKKYSLTIISNGFTEVQYRKLQSSEIEHYFDYVVLSESAGALKPDKQIFEYALKLNNVKADEAIMIGDSYAADIQGAINTGIDQVYFPLHYPQPDKKPICTYLIRSLKDVFDIL